MAKRILIVDDDPSRLKAISAATKAAVEALGCPFDIAEWRPRKEDGDAAKAFESKIDSDTILVASDIELTGGGQTGLFGATVVAWCQKRALAVCGYSQKEANLTKEPNLFEFRLPPDADLAGKKIAAIAKGFNRIHEAFEQEAAALKGKSPTAALAHLLGHSEASATFALYAARLASSNAGLIDLVQKDPHPSNEIRADLAAYVSGHLLANAILAFPGPIASATSLCAYFALPGAAQDAIVKLFEASRYTGPFEELDQFFWVDAVDDEVERLAADHSVKYDEPIDRYRRQVVEVALGRNLGRHTCPQRCGGDRGGYWCPFTLRPVCDRDDCSVGSSSLVPRGAGLTRVERDFFDEWAPLLGL